jgi:hypothetical protein
MALLNVALTAALSGMFILALAGAVRVMVGEITSGPAPVVKLHTKLAANAFPLKSSAAVVIVAVNCVFAAKALVGWKVAVVPAYPTVPGTAAPPVTAKVNVPFAVIVDESIASLKVAVIVSFVGTPIAPEMGSVAITVGGVVSVVVPLVKLQTKSAASALPLALCAAVLIVAVYWVLGDKFAVGANVAVLVAAIYVTVPGTAAPATPSTGATATVNVPAAVTVVGFIA